MLCWVSVGQSKRIRPGEWGNSTHVHKMRHGLLGTSEFSTHRSVSTCDSLSQNHRLLGGSREMSLQNPYRYVVPRPGTSTFVSTQGSCSCTARDEVCSTGDKDGHKHPQSPGKG